MGMGVRNWETLLDPEDRGCVVWRAHTPAKDCDRSSHGKRKLQLHSEAIALTVMALGALA